MAVGERVVTTTYLAGLQLPVREVDLGRVLRGNPIFISALVPYEAGEEVGWFDPALFGPRTTTCGCGFWSRAGGL